MIDKPRVHREMPSQTGMISTMFETMMIFIIIAHSVHLLELLRDMPAQANFCVDLTLRGFNISYYPILVIKDAL